MAYSPRYVNIDDVPVRQVPDDYTEGEKEDALEFAETSLELDINDGERLTSKQLTREVEIMASAAVKQKATCELVKGAEDPTSTKLGDLTDDGTTKTDYADSFCDRYDELVDKINSSGAIEEGEGLTDPYVYNTSDPTPHD